MKIFAFKHVFKSCGESKGYNVSVRFKCVIWGKSSLGGGGGLIVLTKL